MAALPAPTVDSIKKSLKEGRYAPLYVFHGEEGYFIDELCREFEEGILTEDEKVFDQYILYALDTEPQQVLSIVRGVPAIAQRQVVILKEVQTRKSDYLEKLIPYLSDPVQSTIFVICSRGAAIKGKEVLAALKKGGAVVFEGKKIKYDYQLPPYITNIIKERGLTPDPKAVQMLADHVGLDLARVHNEVNKLASILPPGAALTPEAVELHVGISREYNSFELVDAIAARNAVKAFRIVEYFRSNPKAVPLIMVVPQIFNLFADVLTAYYVPGRTDQGIMEALQLKNDWGVKRIRQCMSRYTAVQVVEILGAIREYDAQSKGVGSRRNEHQLFFELIYHILSAPGRV